MRIRFNLASAFLTLCCLILAARVYSQDLAQVGRRKNPVLFMENLGQVTDPEGSTAPDIRFIAKGKNCRIFLRGDGLSYQFEQVDYPEGFVPGNKFTDAGVDTVRMSQITRTTHRMDMRFAGSNPTPTMIREGENPFYENYYNVPSAPEGITGVHGYEKITMTGIYPGIDWVIYSTTDGMKYDFIIHPGADPSQIRMEYLWADSVILNPNGSLTLKTSLGEIREDAPYCYQDGEKVEGRFVVNGNTVSISMTGYDPGRLVTFDPHLKWATYYGGDDVEVFYSVSTDSSGNVYAGGITDSEMGISSGGHQLVHGGGMWDAMLVKFDSNGTRLWATYYGGTGIDYAYCVANDAAGYIYACGETRSITGISTPGCHQPSIASSSDNDAFLVKFNSAGVRQWGTFYGGFFDEYGNSVSTDNAGNVFLGGSTGSPAGIASGGHQNTYAGGPGGIKNYDAFLVKFNGDGVRQWGTYYGGNGTDKGWGTAADPSGNVYLSGETTSNSAIAAGGFLNTFTGGAVDAFLVKFNSAGVRQWGTYYSGVLVGDDSGRTTATDNSGNVYLGGITNSTFGIALGGHQNTYGGSGDAFLVKFNSTGARLWATYYGGTDVDAVYMAAADRWQNVYLAGTTRSTSGIAKSGHQNTYGGGVYDAFAVKFDSAGVRQWGTYYGGIGYDSGHGIAADLFGSVYLAGQTVSSSAIAYLGYKDTLSGPEDAFLAKFRGYNNAPLALCQNVTVYADASCLGYATAADFDAGSSDPDGDSLFFSILPAGPFPLGVTSVMVTVSDSILSSLCVPTITVLDSTPPVAVCQNINAYLNAAGNVTISGSAVNGGCADNCSISTLSLSPSTFNCANLGPNTVTLTATDGSGNSDSCTATVTVQDTLPPAALCHGVTTYLNSAGTASITAAQVNNSSTDNCGVSSLAVSPSTFDCTDLGSNTVTLTVTDSSGNSSTCTALVTVMDTLAPTAACKNITVYLDTLGFVTITGSGVNNGSADNCSLISLSVTPGSFTCADLGVNTVILTATDTGGNSDTCTATVTVLDTVPPHALCQDITLQLLPSGFIVLDPALIDGGSTDACGIDSLWASVDTLTCADISQMTVTLTVSDSSGNTSSCNALVIVVDTAGVTTPTVSISQVDNVLYASPSGPGYTYQWYQGGLPLPGETYDTLLISKSLTATYMVEVTTGMGCVSSGSITLVGLIQPLLSGTLVFPNPGNGHFTLRPGTPISTPVTLRLTDMLGQVLSEYTLSNLLTDEDLDLTPLAAGVYHLSLSCESGYYNVKLVVE